MDNETKLSSEQISQLLSSLRNGKKDEQVNVDEFVNEHLSNEQAAAFKNVLKNPDMIKAMLSSPQAKKLMEKFSKGGSEK